MGVAISSTALIFKSLPSIAQVTLWIMWAAMLTEYYFYYRERLQEGFHITSTHNGYISLCVELSMKVSMIFDGYYHIVQDFGLI